MLLKARVIQLKNAPAPGLAGIHPRCRKTRAPSSSNHHSGPLCSVFWKKMLIEISVHTYCQKFKKFNWFWKSRIYCSMWSTIHSKWLIFFQKDWTDMATGEGNQHSVDQLNDNPILNSSLQVICVFIDRYEYLIADRIGNPSSAPLLLKSMHRIRQVETQFGCNIVYLGKGQICSLSIQPQGIYL